MKLWQWKCLEITFSVFLTGCTMVSAPDLEVSDGQRDFSNRLSRFGQFLKAFPNSILRWSGNPNNPLSTMCQPGYAFASKVATISDCAQSGGVYTSALVRLGPSFPETPSSLYQSGCEGGLRQGFQSSQATTFSIQVSGSTTSIRFDFGGTLYALKDDWTYWDIGLVLTEVEQTAFYSLDNATSAYTHICSDQSQFSLNGSLLSCQLMDDLIRTVSCTPIY